MIKVVTWNIRDLFLQGAREPRLQAVSAVIRDLAPDVLCVQEIRGDSPHHFLRLLAEATGMDCRAIPGDYQWNDDGDITQDVPAVAIGDAKFHLGLMWRPGITPVPGSWRQIGRADGGLWHSAGIIGLQVGGPVPLTVITCLLDPFRPEMRFSEAGRIAALAIGQCAVVAGGFNGLSSDRKPDGTFYDPDPITQRGWYPEATFQVDWDDDPHASPSTSRRAAERLRRAGLIDAACALGAPWQATSGHWDGDPHGPRRVDRILATERARPALTGYQVADTAATHTPLDSPEQCRPPIRIEELSDHLPVVVELDEALLR